MQIWPLMTGNSTAAETWRCHGSADAETNRTCLKKPANAQSSFLCTRKRNPLNTQLAEKRASQTHFNQARNDVPCPEKCREASLGNTASRTIFTGEAPHLSHRDVIFAQLPIVNEMSLCSLWDI